MKEKDIYQAICYLADQFYSPNECDKNGEQANIVDGLFCLARAVDRFTEAYEGAKTDESEKRHSLDVVLDDNLPNITGIMREK